MKLKFKLGLLTGLFFCYSITAGCPRTPSNSDFGLSCLRLTNCYANYGNLLTDPLVKKLVDDAQKSREENKCSEAILEFSTAIKLECPF